MRLYIGYALACGALGYALDVAGLTSLQIIGFTAAFAAGLELLFTRKVDR